MRSADASHSPSSSSATEVTRCSHQCSPAPSAVPRPRTRFNGVIKTHRRAPLEIAAQENAAVASERHDDDHGPARRSECAARSKPSPRPNARCRTPFDEVEEEAERPADEQQLEPRRSERPAARRAIALGSAREPRSARRRARRRPRDNNKPVIRCRLDSHIVICPAIDPKRRQRSLNPVHCCVSPLNRSAGRLRRGSPSGGRGATLEIS